MFFTLPFLGNYSLFCCTKDIIEIGNLIVYQEFSSFQQLDSNCLLPTPSISINSILPLINNYVVVINSSLSCIQYSCSQLLLSTDDYLRCIQLVLSYINTSTSPSFPVYILFIPLMNNGLQEIKITTIEASSFITTNNNQTLFYYPFSSSGQNWIATTPLLLNTIPLCQMNINSDFFCDSLVVSNLSVTNFLNLNSNNSHTTVMILYQQINITDNNITIPSNTNTLFPISSSLYSTYQVSHFDLTFSITTDFCLNNPIVSFNTILFTGNSITICFPLDSTNSFFSLIINQFTCYINDSITNENLITFSSDIGENYDMIINSCQGNVVNFVTCNLNKMYVNHSITMFCCTSHYYNFYPIQSINNSTDTLCYLVNSNIIGSFQLTLPDYLHCPTNRSATSQIITLPTTYPYQPNYVVDFIASVNQGSASLWCGLTVNNGPRIRLLIKPNTGTTASTAINFQIVNSVGSCHSNEICTGMIFSGGDTISYSCCASSEGTLVEKSFIAIIRYPLLDTITLNATFI